MHVFITMDLGPEFVGWSTQVGENVVCAMSPQVQHNASLRRAVRTVVEREGRDCVACQRCPIGQLPT